MSDEGQAGVVRVEFTGRRRTLFGLLLGGYLLMLPTLGIYRFWVTTWKRRFYWQNTVIDGDPLEYSGNALQLLIGFLFAVAFFLPLYLAFFYLSTQGTEIVLLGYGVVAALFWFMTGYAQYRARDFRLSRTLWRGIRFDQRGNAWTYAIRRFLWSILVLATVGLAYPFMAASLWRYRYGHSWYGDRQFRWSGGWKTLALPFYLSYLVCALAIGLAVAAAVATPAIRVGGESMPDPSIYLVFLGAGLVVGLMTFYFRARQASRMFSEVWIGEARLAVRVRARALFGQFVLYLVAVLLAGIVLMLVAGGVIAAFLPGGLQASAALATDLGRAAQTSWVVLPLLIAGYLVILGMFTLLGEVFLGLGYWILVARGATVTNIDSLASVRATGEDRALAGEGLADALNVGAY